MRDGNGVTSVPTSAAARSAAGFPPLSEAPSRGEDERDGHAARIAAAPRESHEEERRGRGRTREEEAGAGAPDAVARGQEGEEPDRGDSGERDGDCGAPPRAFVLDVAVDLRAP